MTENRSLNEDPSSVQAHLTIMQGVIQRMAENSRSCKVWCVTLVAATLVLVARTGEPQHALIALVSRVNHNCRFGVNQYAGDCRLARRSVRRVWQWQPTPRGQHDVTGGSGLPGQVIPMPQEPEVVVRHRSAADAAGPGDFPYAGRAGVLGGEFPDEGEHLLLALSEQLFSGACGHGRPWRQVAPVIRNRLRIARPAGAFRHSRADRPPLPAP